MIHSSNPAILLPAISIVSFDTNFLYGASSDNAHSGPMLDALFKKQIEGPTMAHNIGTYDVYELLRCCRSFEPLKIKPFLVQNKWRKIIFMQTPAYLRRWRVGSERLGLVILTRPISSCSDMTGPPRHRPSQATRQRWRRDSSSETATEFQVRRISGCSLEMVTVL